MPGSPVMQPQAEGRAALHWPIAALGDTGNASAAAAANQGATVVLAADASRAHIISEVIWSYSSDPTGGRLTIADPSGNLVDVDIPKGGPGFLPLTPPLRLAHGSAATITLAAGGAAVTGKVNVVAWRMQ